MTKFVIKIVLFFIVLLVADGIIGNAFDVLSVYSKDETVSHHRYIVNDISEDVLIFGSSRALHHYNPRIISDSLGLSCYNCGHDGNGIILFNGIWKEIKQIHIPKMIIYDVFPLYDFAMGEDNHRYLGWMKMDYHNHRHSIEGIFDKIDKVEKYKMQSSLYRWNSDFLETIIGLFKHGQEFQEGGFQPLKGGLDKLKIRNNIKVPVLVIDSIKMSMMEEFLNETKGLKVVFVASPSWYGILEKNFDPIKEICQKHNILFLNYAMDKKYVGNSEFFKDGSHLNELGANEFTRDLVKVLKCN